MPNNGSQGPNDEELRDWLLGGNRKRRILECLARPPAGGWSAEALATELGCGSATVYETLRILRGAALLETVRVRRYRLARGTRVAKSLRALIVALAAEGSVIVDRPPRSRR